MPAADAGRATLVAIFLMGFASGLPLALVGGTLMLWLTEANLSMDAISTFALVRSPYSLKFLWSPLIDGVPIPFLSRWLGQRRSWVILTQIGLGLGLVILGACDPATGVVQMATSATVVAVLSATHDIAIDGLRVGLLPLARQGPAASATQMGYRLGMIVSGAGALVLAGRAGWSMTYDFMAMLIGFGAAGCLMVAEPVAETAVAPGMADPVRFLTRFVLAPLAELWRLDRALVTLAFVPLYFLGDAIAGTLSSPFYLRVLGFSKDELAEITKLLGVGASVAGVMLGGAVVYRLGARPALLVCGIAKILTSFLYLVQLRAGHDLLTLAFTITAENLAGGAAGSAFVAYLSGLCRRSHAATQYALLSALGTLGTNIVGASAGAIELAVGWAGFFLVSAALGLPALLLLPFLARPERSLREA